MTHSFFWRLNILFLFAALPTLAWDGNPGANGMPAVIQADGSSQQYNLSGGNGGNGSQGYNGHNAACYSTGGPSNVHQPSGGAGSDGGNGGRGGDGGNITVYFTNIESIRRIYVRGTPGYGGAGGYGGQGGSGCRCSQHSWSIPNPDPAQPAQTYYCTDGSDGWDGRRGSNGARGNYGHVYLIQATEPLKPSMPSVYLDMSKMTTAPVSLSQNNWETKTGARSLFQPGSDLRDAYYSFKDRVEAEITFQWAADRPMTDFKGYQMLVHLVGSEVKVDFPQGILIESDVKNENGKITYTVLSALKSSEVANLQWGTFQGNGSTLSVGVKDNANVSHHVDTDITLSYYSRESGRYQLRFKSAVPEEAIKSTTGGFEVALGALGIKEDYLKRGTAIYVDMTVTRTAGGVARAVRLARYFVISPMAVGDTVEVLKDTNLYSGTTVVGKVLKGETYLIQAIQGAWISLKKPDGTLVTGWIKQSEIKLVEGVKS